ncbi:unnamed protein product [Discosporangium mesarthrocarpum]
MPMEPGQVSPIDLTAIQIPFMARHCVGFTHACTLVAMPDFVAEETWHVLADHGVHVRESPADSSRKIQRLPFATMLTVREKRGAKVRISSPVVGWLPIAEPSGYLLVCQEGAQVGCSWRFRVVCADGAVVREGLDLVSPFLYTLPCHSIVEVFERKLNKLGLMRLQLSNGWISEVLNPLSGQGGPVVELVNMIRPLQFRVVWPEGAVVRQSSELGSRMIKTLSLGELAAVDSKCFSDNPPDRCVKRLRLAGGTGWVSLHLNKPKPHDKPVVEFVKVLPLSTSSKGNTRDLEKIKGDSLGDDDACILCLSGYVPLFVRLCTFVCQVMYLCLSGYVPLFVRFCTFVYQVMYLSLSGFVPLFVIHRTG